MIYDFCKQKKYGEAYAEYWVSHPFDEALLGYGIVEPAGPPHHILSRGAHGKIDEHWNLLSLSRENHTSIHKSGNKVFMDKFPFLAEKIMQALDKEGRDVVE